MDLVVAAIALALFIVSIVGSIAGNRIASGLYDCAPFLARWLIDKASVRLSARDRQRYREQWHADNNDWPGGRLGKIWHAIGCYFSARQIARLSNSKSDRKMRFVSDTFEMIIIVRGEGLRAWKNFPFKFFVETLFRTIRRRELPRLTIKKAQLRETDSEPNSGARLTFYSEKLYFDDIPATPGSRSPDPPVPCRPT